MGEKKNTETMKVNMEDSRWVGDASHVISLIGTITFAAAVMYEVSGLQSRKAAAGSGSTTNSNASNSTRIFDPAWVETGGFCIANANESYGNSHDMCLWVDTCLALMCCVLYALWRKVPGMASANTLFQAGIPGVLVHGMVHGFAGNDFRKKYQAQISSSNKENVFLDDSTDLLSHGWLPPLDYNVVGHYLFWIFMFKAAMPNIRFSWITLLSVVVGYTQIWVPQIYGFTYTQTVLLLAFSINQLARPRAEKDWAYALYPVFVGLPLIVVGWMESLACHDWVGPYLYGHVVYDAYIPLAMMAWYTTLYLRNTSTASRSSSKVKQV
jgi:hypothetical protein